MKRFISLNTSGQKLLFIVHFLTIFEENAQGATLLDRKPHYTIILKLTGKDVSSVHAELFNTFTECQSNIGKP